MRKLIYFTNYSQSSVTICYDLYADWRVKVEHCVKMPKVYMNKTDYGGAKLEMSTVFFKYFMTLSSVIFSNPLEETISPLLSWCELLKFNFPIDLHVKHWLVLNCIKWMQDMQHILVSIFLCSSIGHIFS